MSIARADISGITATVPGVSLGGVSACPLLLGTRLLLTSP